MQYLKNKNRGLRARLPQHIMTTPAERARLLKYGRPLGLAINQLVTIVVPGTFHRWVRESKGQKRKQFLTIGRPKKPLDLKNLILKIARETGWGYTRALGEIRKLTRHRISRRRWPTSCAKPGSSLVRSGARRRGTSLLKTSTVLFIQGGVRHRTFSLIRCSNQLS